MSKSHNLEVFEREVSVRYQLYNALFSTLPYEELEELGSQLPVFATEARTRLAHNDSPVAIVEDFLCHFPKEKRTAALFRFLQMVERQVLLFDAIEEAEFDHIHNLVGAGTLEAFLARVEDNDQNDALLGLLKDYRVRIVLTAHPTQFYPDPVLGIIRDLSDAIRKDDVQQIRLLLMQVGRTKFRNREKPTPLQEARSVLWYLENTFYPIVPDIQRQATRLFPDEIATTLPPLMEIGFWPGGDRDGNPFVTAEVTQKVSQELKGSILRLYTSDVEALFRRLTFDGVYEVLIAIHHKLLETLEGIHKGTSGGYTSAEELLQDLESVAEVVRTKHQGLFIEGLENLLARVHTFGFHFATMDIRQDSRIHEAALDELMPKLAGFGLVDLATAASYANLDEDGKIEVLCSILQKPAPTDLIERAQLDDGLTRETLMSYRAVRQIQQCNGVEGLHRSIISNTQSVLDLFEVLVFIHLSGWDWREAPLDIVPLFETIEDLHNSFSIMAALYQHPIYRQHLERRYLTQPIMVGFSDGTKDGGYLGANWGIYQAKRDLTQISREHDVHVVFFDGRGGPPARGGGNTHRFYRSMGKDIEHTQIQLTIQGQTISSNFGTLTSARYNLEQMFTAGLESFLFHAEEGLISEADGELIANLANSARQKYLDFKAHPLFIPYLEEMTPLRYYDRLNVGSRPAKRKSGSQLRFEDLRAIPFVGSWSQVKQNIPGFYGLGTALAEIRDDQSKWAQVQRLYHDSLFFQTLIENAMQSLSKTYFPLTGYLKDDERFGEFWKNIYDEATLTKAMLKEVSGMSVLLEREAATRQSIYMREKIVLPLLVIQQYAIDRVRAAEDGRLQLSEDEVETLRKLIVRSLAANVNAARNSA